MSVDNKGKARWTTSQPHLHQWTKLLKCPLYLLLVTVNAKIRHVYPVALVRGVTPAAAAAVTPVSPPSAAARTGTRARPRSGTGFGARARSTRTRAAFTHVQFVLKIERKKNGDMKP